MRVLYKGVEHQAKLLGKREDGSFQVELHDAAGEAFVAAILPENVITEEAAEDPESEDESVELEPEKPEKLEPEKPEKPKKQDDDVVKFSIFVVAAFVLYYY